MKRILVLLTAAVLLLSAGCADKTADAVATVKPEKPERDDSLYYENNTVFHIGKPNEMQFLIPRVPDPVSPEEFWGDGGPAAEDCSLDCIRWDGDADGKTVSLGLIYPNDTGGYAKVCTQEDCRADMHAPCSHLTAEADFAVRYGDAVYFSAAFAGPGGKTVQYAVLEWKIGAGVYDKLFEAPDEVSDLYVLNGILYANVGASLMNGEALWKLVRMDKEISTEVSVSGYLLFGSDGIVKVGPEGVTVLDELLNPVRTVLDKQLFGAVAGGYYWYLEDGTLWRVPTDKRANSEKILSGVADFNVSGRFLWTLDAESGELWRAEWKKNGALVERVPVYRPTAGERIETVGAGLRNFRKPVCGDYAFWVTVSDDGNVRKGYVSNGKTAVETWRQP